MPGFIAERAPAPLDPRGFNIFISPEEGFEIGIGLVELETGRLVTRFLFNVGQPDSRPSIHLDHVDIPDVGGISNIETFDPCEGRWEITLTWGADTRLKVSARNEGGSFHLSVSAVEIDDSIRPFFWVGSLHGATSCVTCDGGELSLDLPGGRIALSFVRGSSNDVSAGPENFPASPAFISCGPFDRAVLALHGIQADPSGGDPVDSESALHEGRVMASDPADPGPPWRWVVVSFDGHSRMTLAARAPDAAVTQSKRQPCKFFGHGDLPRGIGPIAGAAVNGVVKVVAGNTIWDFSTKSPYTVVNRAWVEMIGRVFKIDDPNLEGPVVINWANSFSALLASVFSPELARANILKLIDMQREDGKIPQMQIGGFVNGRSNPPVAPFIAWKIYLKHGDQEFLSTIYPAMARWLDWFDSNRKDRYGLYAWGTCEPQEKQAKSQGNRRNIGKIDAYYESGIDDSPMWDELEWDQEKGLFAASCVDLSSLMALSRSVLARMARELGLQEESDEHQRKAEEISTRIDDLLFDGKASLYRNRRHDGAFARFVTPTSFYPMLAGVPDSKTAAEIIPFGLLNRDLCWGDFPMCSVAKSFWGYEPDGDYWRGRIWPPLNYLVYQGLRNYSHKAAHRLAAVSGRIFHREFSTECHCHENYSALTGWGEAETGKFSRSCPFFTWGGLLGLMTIEELVDVELDGSLRIGSPFFTEEAGVDGILLKGRKWTVRVAEEGLSVSVDGAPFLSSFPAVGLRNLSWERDRMSFQLYGIAETSVTLFPWALVGRDCVARLYDSDTFIGKFAIASGKGLEFPVNLENEVVKTIKIKLI